MTLTNKFLCALNLDCVKSDLLLSCLGYKGTTSLLDPINISLEPNELRIIACKHLALIWENASLDHGSKQVLVHGVFFRNSSLINTPMGAYIDAFYENETSVFDTSVQSILSVINDNCTSELCFSPVENFGVCSSPLLKEYDAIDNRVSILVVEVLRWAKHRGVSVDPLNSPIRPLCLTVLVIRFLQRVQPPVIPTLPVHLENTNVCAPGNWQGRNKDSVLVLLGKFFLSYSVCFKDEPSLATRRAAGIVGMQDVIQVNIFNDVVCVQPNFPGGYSQLGATGTSICVEDPFEANQDIGASTHNPHNLVLFLNELRRAVLLFARKQFDEIFRPDVHQQRLDGERELEVVAPDVLVPIDYSLSFADALVKGGTSFEHLLSPSEKREITDLDDDDDNDGDGFIAEVLGWKLGNILDVDLLSDRLSRIPERFQDSTTWYHTFYPFIVEEMRACLQNKFEKKFDEFQCCPGNWLNERNFQLILPHKIDGVLTSEEFPFTLALLVKSRENSFTLEKVKGLEHHLVQLGFPKRKDGGSKNDEALKEHGGETVFDATINDTSITRALLSEGSAAGGWKLLLLGIPVIASVRMCEALANKENPSPIMTDVITASVTVTHAPFIAAGEIDYADGLDQSCQSLLCDLNQSQRNAVLTVLGASTDKGLMSVSNAPIQLIKGPPGTGKTATLVALLRCLVASELQVHATAPTNIAVCELATRLMKSLIPCSTESASSCGDVFEGGLRMADFLLIGTKQRLGLSDVNDRSQSLHRVYLESRVDRISQALMFLRINTPVLLRSLRTRQNSFQKAVNDEGTQVVEPACGTVFHKAVTESALEFRECFTILNNEAPHKYRCCTGLELSKLLRAFKTITTSTVAQFQGWLTQSDDMALWRGLSVAFEMASTTLSRLKVPITPELHLLKISVAEAAKLVFSTVNVGGRSLFRNINFDVVIIDEATQLVQAETAIVLRKSLKCIVLAGDDKQLPSTVLSTRNQSLKYGDSLFERLIRQSYPHSLLNVQYRMHPQISNWPSMMFYNGSLANGSNVLSPSYQKDWHQHYPPLSVYDIKTGCNEKDTNGSSFNEVEAEVVRRLTHKIRNSIKTSLTIGIVTPYSAQVELLAHLRMDSSEDSVRRITRVSTVDGFQGQECDIIIFSAVRSNPARNIGFLRDERRLNVALTRAKYCLIVVCNAATVASNGTWAHFIQYAQIKKRIYTQSTNNIIQVATTNWMKQEDQIKSLRTVMNSQVFEKSIWKVVFANEFRKATESNSQVPVQKLMKVVLNLSNGNWPKRESIIYGVSAAYSEIIHAYNFNGWSLVWSVDVDKPSGKQCIRLWDVVLPSAVIDVVRKVENKFIFYSDQYVEMCRDRKSRQGSKEWHPCAYIIDKDFKWTKKLTISTSVEATTGGETKQAEDEENTIDIDVARHDGSAMATKFYSLSSELARLLLAQVDDGTIELPFEMSKLEDEIVRFPGSAFVLGRSGTGKTTVILHRMYLQSRAQLGSRELKEISAQRQLMLTTSPILCDSIRRSYDSMCRTDKFIERANTATAPNPDNTIALPLSEDTSERTYPLLLSACSETHFPLITTYATFLRMLDGDLPEKFFSYKNCYREEVTHSRFRSHYAPHFSEKKMVVDVSVLFKEIMSHIKGSVQALYEVNGRLSEEQYIALSEQRQSELSREQRTAIYALYLRYEHLKVTENSGDYDLLDLVFHAHLTLRKYPDICNSLQMFSVYVDEVQDLVPAQIALLRFVCENPGGYLFAGDTAQTIAHGVGFRFETVKDIFYHEFLKQDSGSLGVCSGSGSGSVVMPKTWNLTENFRTHTGVVSIANSVVKLILSYFPLSIDKLEDESSSVSGPVPVFLQQSHGEDLFHSLFHQSAATTTEVCEFGAEQVILVRDEACKQDVKEIVGNKALVLTALEAKGMEFTDCLLYNFFDSSPLGNAWRVLYRDVDPTQPHPKFDPNKHSGLCHELKQLYVLLTRARQNLIIYDSNIEARGPMLQYWTRKNLVRVKALDEDIRCIFLSFSTPEEWVTKGKQFYERNQFGNAKLCFQRARNDNLVSLCIASELEDEANNRCVKEPIQATKLYLSAAKMFNDLGGYPLNSARCYEKGGEYEIAAGLFRTVGRLLEAAVCFERAKKWIDAAILYELRGDKEKSLDCCYKQPDFDQALKFLDNFLETKKISDKDYVEIQQTCVKKALLHLHNAKKPEEMMRFVELLPSLKDKRTFLRRYNYQELLLAIEIKAECYSEAAILSEEITELLNAAKYYQLAGNNVASVRCIISHISDKYYDEKCNRKPTNAEDMALLGQAELTLTSIPSLSSSSAAADSTASSDTKSIYALQIEYLKLSSSLSLSSEGSDCVLEKLFSLSESAFIPKEEKIYFGIMVHRTIIQFILFDSSSQSNSEHSGNDKVVHNKKLNKKHKGSGRNSNDTAPKASEHSFDALRILHNSIKQLHSLLETVINAFARISSDAANKAFMVSPSNWEIIQQSLRCFNFIINTKSIINVKATSIVQPKRLLISSLLPTTSITLLEFSQNLVQLLAQEVQEAAIRCADLFASSSAKVNILKRAQQLNLVEKSKSETHHLRTETLKYCQLQYNVHELHDIALKSCASAGVSMKAELSEVRAKMAQCCKELAESVLPDLTITTERADELCDIRINYKHTLVSLAQNRIITELRQPGMNQDTFCRGLLYAELTGSVPSTVLRLLNITKTEEDKHKNAIKNSGEKLIFVNKFQRDLALEYQWQYCGQENAGSWPVGCFYRSVYCTSDVLIKYMRYTLNDMFNLRATPQTSSAWVSKRSFVSPIILVKLLEKNMVWLMLHWKRCSGVILLDSLARDVLCRDDKSYFDTVVRFSNRSKSDWGAAILLETSWTASNKLFEMMRWLMIFLGNLTSKNFDAWISWNSSNISDIEMRTIKTAFYTHMVQLIMLYVVNQSIQKTRVLLCTQLAQLLQNKVNAIHSSPPYLLTTVKSFDAKSIFSTMDEYSRRCDDKLLLLGVQSTLPYYRMSRSLNTVDMMLQATEPSVVTLVDANQLNHPHESAINNDGITDSADPPAAAAEIGEKSAFSAEDDTHEPPPAQDGEIKEDKLKFYHDTLIQRLHEARARLASASQSELLNRFFEKNFLLAGVEDRRRHAAQLYSKTLSPIVVLLRDRWHKLEAQIADLNAQAHVDLEAVDTAKDAVDAIQAHIDAIMENLIDRVRSKEDLESHISGLADSALECLDKFL